MKLSVRPADLYSDRDALIDLMLRYLTPMSDGPRYDWLYCRNPDGPARVWVMVDELDGNMVGSAAAIPRQMYVGKQRMLGCVLMDFWIHPKYRSVGPAVQLQRACMDSIGPSCPFSLFYDLPSASMLSVYKRLKIPANDHLVRMAKLLRVDRRVAEILKAPFPARLASALANSVLWLHDIRPEGRHTADLQAEEGDFGEEYSTLAREAASEGQICVARTAEYLNWRFERHHKLRFERATARYGGKLVAFAIFRMNNNIAEIVDVIGIKNRKVIGDLLVYIVQNVRRKGLDGVSIQLSPHGPFVPILRSLGFHRRASVPIVVNTPFAGPVHNATFHWYLSQGDWP